MENILAPGGAPRRYDNELIRLELVFKHDGRGRECGRDHMTAFRLHLLGVPLPWTLGALTGSLNFIPNLGPIIAVVPAVILAFAQSPRQALYTLALNVILQSLDGYVFTPLMQRRTVALPPALTITAQVALGVLLGGLGALLATPLAAAALVIVKMLYLRETPGLRITQTSGDGSL